MRRLSLRMKLAVGFGAPVLVLVAMGIITYTTFQTVGELSTNVAEKARSLGIMQSIESRICDQRAEVRGFLLDGRHEIRPL